MDDTEKVPVEDVWRVKREGFVWGVYRNNELVEGGFANREAADDARDEWLLQIQLENDKPSDA